MHHEVVPAAAARVASTGPCHDALDLLPSDLRASCDRAVVSSFVTASVLSGIGALLVAYPPGSAVGAEAGNQWFGVALLAAAALAWLSLARQIHERRAHPIA